jgi:hypothetical protein
VRHVRHASLFGLPPPDAAASAFCALPADALHCSRDAALIGGADARGLKADLVASHLADGDTVLLF